MASVGVLHLVCQSKQQCLKTQWIKAFRAFTVLPKFVFSMLGCATRAATEASLSILADQGQPDKPVRRLLEDRWLMWPWPVMA